MSAALPGERVVVHQRAPYRPRPGTVMDHRNTDTWPTMLGHYTPNRPFSNAILVRWDDWPDDEWQIGSHVERT